MESCSLEERKLRDKEKTCDVREIALEYLKAATGIYMKGKVDMEYTVLGADDEVEILDSLELFLNKEGIRFIKAAVIFTVKAAFYMSGLTCIFGIFSV